MMRTLVLNAVVGALAVSAISGPYARGPAGKAQAQPAPAAKTVAAPTAPNAQAVTRPLDLEPAMLRKALASIPALAQLAQSFVPFSAADADAALRRGGHHREHMQPWSIMPAAFAWMPEPGKELWVLSGRAGARTLIALLYPVGPGHFSHAASTVIEEPDATVAIGASEQYPKQLVFSTCYGCAGEGGTIRLDAEGHVEITYR